MQNLRLFCALVDTRSFSLAAQRHGITQSAASQRIGQLEKRLGVRLVDRSVRPLTLTPAGELFARESWEILERYDRLVQGLTTLRQDPSGEVRVHAIYSAGIDLLQEVCDSFEQQTPHVRVTIHYQRPEAVYEAVRSQRCDLGIISYPQRHRDMNVVALRDEVMAVICVPQHPLARRATVHARDLGHWPMIAFEAELPVAKHIRKYLRDHAVTPQITHVFDNVDTIKSAVAATGQLAILPLRTALREVHAKTLVAVRLQPTVVRPMGIIYRRGGGAAPLSQAAQRFVDFLRRHAGPDPRLADEPQPEKAARESSS